MMLDDIRELETVPACDLDFAIPSRVAELDANLLIAKEALEMMEARIREMELDRNALLVRAKDLAITTDANYKIIESPVYAKKKVDVRKLQQLDPDRYKQILANIRSRIQDKINAEIDKAETFISQTDIKSIIRDKAILAMVIPENTEILGYVTSVVRR